DQVQVTLNSGAQIKTDMVILSIGVAPDTAFLKNSGLALGPRGHIIVNEKMETNLEGIYGVGDASEVVDYITKQKAAIALAGPANKQARIAADNVAGLQPTYQGTQGTSILKIFSLTAASTGANERTLQRANLPYKVIHIHPSSHGTYYPGAKPMALKLIFNDAGRVLGAQAIGYEGVDKRIDVIAAAIRFNGTVDDLAGLELAYAPPYSSAKDPVNMAGFVAQNLLSGKTQVITGRDLDNYSEDYVLLDVRTQEEFENGHMAGAVNIPLDSLRKRINELDKNKTIITYCLVGVRGYSAERILRQRGFTALNLTGGYKTARMLNYNPTAHSADDDGGGANPPAHKTVAPDPQAEKKTGENEPGPCDQELDACGLSCPGPLLQVKASMDGLKDGQVLKVTASDPGFYEDIKAWCKRTNNELVELAKASGNVIAFIRKNPQSELTGQNTANLPVKDNKTIIVFSGELDKAFASFIIANGAAAMGKKVTMFFTFWGLNILRKPEKVAVKKVLVDSMFGMMMPRGTKKLKISNMNMMGLGTMMMKKVMRDKNVSSLEELIQSGIDSGIEMVACQMSMDVMGIKLEELIDGVKVGGVGYMLSEAEDSNVNLFI
ncbi:MAG: DsrE/DsrF/DrsH-like family protein, partial [Desulfotomaculaceae bacterium]|nr:DsrE/DsrF/DrsH-like family protein [Desulfotomaculaceae bacterium]